MIAVWRRWVGLCARREPGAPFAWMRIAVGLIAFGHLASHIFGDVLDPLYVPLREGGLARLQSDVHPLVQWMGGHSAWAVRWIARGALGLSVLVVAGAGGRLPPLVLSQLLVALQGMQWKIGGGYDRLLVLALLVVALAQCTATWSVDCRRRTGRWTSKRPVPVWPRYVAALQLTILYTGAGVAKIGGAWESPWLALYRSLLRINYVRGDFTWVAQIVPLTQIGTVVSLYWERSFVVLLLWLLARDGLFGPRVGGLARRYDLRWVWLGIGVVLHVSLLLTMALGPFSWVSLALYLPLLTSAGPSPAPSAAAPYS